MSKKNDQKYTDFSNVKNMDNLLTPEEFPEGSFESPIHANDPVYGKSTEWKQDQQRDSAFVYPDRDRHESLPRQTPGAHPLHDEPDSK